MRRREFEYSVCGFVCQGRRRVPGLDLLAEDGLEVGGVGFEDGGAEGRVVDCVEEFGAEGADVVEVEFEGVDGGGLGCAGDELLAGEFGGEGHCWSCLWWVRGARWGGFGQLMRYSDLLYYDECKF